MLLHLQEKEAAHRLQRALENVYLDARYLTPDVGGHASTSEFTDAVIRVVEAAR
jgi:isocitrate/isopropylmalate dehydrogenase